MNQPFEGIVKNLERRYKETQSMSMRWELEQYMSEHPCPDCGGKRLKKEVLAVTVGGINIVDFTDKSIVQALSFIDGLTLTEKEEMIAHRILKEIRERLGFLRSVGLEYLTLGRQGGEPVRRREPAHPARHADRVVFNGRFVHS